MIESVKWGPNKQQQFVEWIVHEHLNSLGARDSLERKWRLWLEQYRAPADQPIKKFPYEGASNYVMPITATDVDLLYAKFIQTIHAPDNLWTVAPLNERWVDAAKPLQDFLQFLDKTVLKMYNVNKRVLLEMVKLGTGIYKHGWMYEKRKIRTYDETGKIVTLTKIQGKPFVDHVRLTDFLIPPYSYAISPDVQGGAPWVAERHRVNVDVLRSIQQASEPFLPQFDADAVKLVINFAERTASEYDEKVQDLDYNKTGRGVTPDFDKSSTSETDKGPSGVLINEVEIWEFHARFATQGDSQDDIVVWMHLPTQTVLRAVYGYYLHNQRPYDVVRYFPAEGFYGIGVCEQKEMFQKLGSDLMNYQMDNVLLSNARGIVAKSGGNITAGEPVYPYKIWLTDGDPRAEFSSFAMADIYASLPNLIAQVEAIGQRRTGISDIQAGNMNELPGRTPATTMLSLLQEGNRRPDLTLKDIRNEGLSTVGLRLLQLCQQYMGNPTGDDVGGARLLQLSMTALGDPEGQFAGQKLATPLENAELGLGVSLTATSGSANKEVEKQNLMGLLQLAAQIYPQYIQLAQVGLQAMAAGATPVADAAFGGIRGTSEIFKRLLEQYDIRNPESIVPEDLERSSQQLLQQLAGAAGAQPGAGGQPAGLGGQPALQGVPGSVGTPVPARGGGFDGWPTP